MSETVTAEPKSETKTQRIERHATVFAVGHDFAIPSSRGKARGEASINELYDNAFKTFSPSFVQNGHGKINKGVKTEHEKKMPAFASLLGVSVNSPNWEQEVRTFWIEYEEKLPFGRIENGEVVGGRAINASYTIAEDGNIYPDEIQDYIIYELMLVDRYVGRQLEDWGQKDNFKFFCIDTEVLESKKKDELEIDLRATRALAKLEKDPDSTDKMRYILCVIPDSGYLAMDALKLEKPDLLREMVKLVKDRPRVLLDALATPNLASKAFLTQLVESSLIRKIGTDYFLDNQILGKESDAIAYLNSPTHAEEVQVLRTKLDTFQTLGNAHI